MATTFLMREVELIRHEDLLLAIIVPGSFSEPGIHFFTPNELSQQLAYMRHPPAKSLRLFSYSHATAGTVHTGSVVAETREATRRFLRSAPELYR